VRLLVEAGADPNLNKHGWTALRCAIKEAKEDVALILLEFGSKFEGNDFTSAAEAGMEKVIKFMIDAGIDVNFQTEDDGSTALCAAARTGREIIVDLLRSVRQWVYSPIKPRHLPMHGHFANGMSIAEWSPVHFSNHQYAQFANELTNNIVN
jgi:ankyrin repeat protein